MNYEQKLESVCQIVEDHNGQVSDEGKINFAEFKTNLLKLGGTNERALNLCSYEDLQSFGLPILLAKQCAEIFRKKSDNSNSEYGSKQLAQIVMEKLRIIIQNELSSEDVDDKGKQLLIRLLEKVRNSSIPQLLNYG